MMPSRGDRASSLRRIVVSAIAAMAAATLALILIALVVPARIALALHWYFVLGGAIVTTAALRAFLARYPVLWQATDPTADRRPPAADLPARLRAITSLVTRSRWDAAGLRMELLPLLRAIAAQRLATYRSLALDGAGARNLLGERVWTFLMTDGLEPPRRDQAVDLADLSTTVERLERLHVSADD